MEYWDIYNADRIKTGKIIERGEYLNDDEYHIVVNAWILRKDGKYRRRLDFATVRHILDFVLIDMENYQKLF